MVHTLGLGGGLPGRLAQPSLSACLPRWLAVRLAVRLAVDWQAGYPAGAFVTWRNAVRGARVTAEWVEAAAPGGGTGQERHGRRRGLEQRDYRAIPRQ